MIVKRPGFQPYTSEITISDDQSRDVKATLLEEKGGITGSPGRSATVLVVGGGAVAGYFAFQPNNQQPVVGDLTPGTVTTASYPGLAGVSGFRTVPGVAGFHTMPGPVGRT